MNMHGIDNVRGGSFCTIMLTEDDKKFLNKMIEGANDKCFKCGKKGHFAKNCYKIKYKNDLIKKDEDEDDDDDDDGFEIIDNIGPKKIVNEEAYYSNITINDKICFKCGRKGHLAIACNEIDHLFGKNMDRCYNCGRNDHLKLTCKQKTDIFGRKINIGLVNIGKDIFSFIRSL